MSGAGGAVGRLVVLVGALAVAGAAVAIVGPGTIGAWLRAIGESAWGPPAFVAAFAVAVVALMPGTIGTVAAGAVFGFRLGFVVALSGATIGAGIAFLVARWLGRDGIERILGRRRVGWYRPVETWIAGNDFVSILVLRVMPIVPFNGLNYAAGLTPVRFSRYLPASVAGMAPGTALVAFAGAEAGDPTGPRFLGAMTAVAVATVLSIVASRRLRARHA